MESRRNFLKTTGSMVAGSILLPSIAKASLNMGLASSQPIGIQMFTATNFMGKDTKAFLAELAKIGYKEIETAGGGGGMYYGHKPKELKSMIEDLGMKWVAHHSMGGKFELPEDFEMTEQIKAYMEGMRTLQDDHKLILEDAIEGGWEYLVCASTPIATVDEINKSIETFVKVGEDCKDAGIQFAYHNHATEFDLVDGKTPYERILSQTDKDMVKMEMDMGWVTKAGKDPLQLFKENPGRFPLWHFKDYDLKNDNIVIAGEGDVDFKRIMTGAELAGMKHIFYEQDTASSLDDVSKSYKNIANVI